MMERVEPGGLATATDDELFATLREASRGSERHRAFRELFDRHHGRVFRWSQRLLGDATAAEDLVQTVFLELWSKAAHYEGRERFGAWLYVVTRNRCLNALRSARRESVLPEPEAKQATAADSDPLAALEREEIDEHIDAVCRQRLEPVEYQVIQLRYVWSMRVDEISRALRLQNASGARTHLRSAEAKLRRYLKHIHRSQGTEP